MMRECSSRIGRASAGRVPTVRVAAIGDPARQANDALVFASNFQYAVDNRDAASRG